MIINVDSEKRNALSMSIKCENECKRTLTSQEMVKLVTEIQFRRSKCRIVTVFSIPVAK